MLGGYSGFTVLDRVPAPPATGVHRIPGEGDGVTGAENVLWCSQSRSSCAYCEDAWTSGGSLPALSCRAVIDGCGKRCLEGLVRACVLCLVLTPLVFRLGLEGSSVSWEARGAGHVDDVIVLLLIHLHARDEKLAFACSLCSSHNKGSHDELKITTEHPCLELGSVRKSEKTGIQPVFFPTASGSGTCGHLISSSPESDRLR